LEQPEGAGDYWLWATVGEASILAGDHDGAVQYLPRAADLMLHRGAVGDLVAMLLNLKLLADGGATQKPDWLQERIGNLVVFAGHRIDPPQWAAGARQPRFPNDPPLVGQVQGAIRRWVNELNVRIGFCSLACGSDILFAEAMLARNAELHVVLPFARDDFLRTSVDYGSNQPSLRVWRYRFEAVLAQLPTDHLHFATEEPYLGDDLLFAYTNTYLQGLALVRARQYLTEPVALVVLDPDAKAWGGGTRDFFNQWDQARFKTTVIDLAKLREGVRAAPLVPDPPSPPSTPSELPRAIRSMLFADVANFSKMNEELAPRFFARFPQAVADTLKGFTGRYLLANTWGDGFFAVFDAVADCAAFALELIDRVGEALDWQAMGFPDVNPLRVGLHAGPVFELDKDPVLGRRNFFGQHVNRTARIEPVTMPGCAYASEQFAALLTVKAADSYRCDLIGVEKLPKKAGAYALYRVSCA